MIPVQNTVLSSPRTLRVMRNINRLPKGTFDGATPLSRERGGRKTLYKTELDAESLGIRRINSQCLEIASYGNLYRNSYANGVGISIIFGIVASLSLYFMAAPPIYVRDIVIWLSLPFLVAAVGFLLYLATKSSFGNFRGGSIRAHREARRIYFVHPLDRKLVMLEWEEIQAMAAFVPVFGAAGYTSLHPLYLIGVDWTQAPPQEALISCGNLGWRDNGEFARQLWCCLQRFMEEGPQGVPVPQALPPRMSRWQTFAYGYRQWAMNFRKDLSEPGGKLKAIILAPGKVIWLSTVVFTDSIAEVLEYNVPYTQFPKEIDELCGFHEDATVD